MQAYAAGQKILEEDDQLAIPLASCTDLRNDAVLLGQALPGVGFQVCDDAGRVLPPDIPGRLILEGNHLPSGKQTTSLQVSYTWEGVLTVLISQVIVCLRCHRTNLTDASEGHRDSCALPCLGHLAYCWPVDILSCLSESQQ